MAHVSGVHHVITAKISSRECNQIHEAEDTADSCAPLLTPCRSKLNENQREPNMVSVKGDTAKKEAQKEGNANVKLENFGKQVDDELQDLERFGIFITPIHHRQKKTSLSHEQQQPARSVVQSESSSSPPENSDQSPSQFASVHSNSSRSGSSRSGHHKQKRSSSSDEQQQPARSVIQSQSSSSPSARSAQSSSHSTSVRSNSGRSYSSGSGGMPSSSSSCSSNSTSSSQSNHVISSPMTASFSTCSRSTSAKYNRFSQCDVQQIVSSPMTGLSYPSAVGNALIVKGILEPINNNGQETSNINGGNDTSQYTVNNIGDDQSYFSPAEVQAEISRRLAAKEQYHMHKMRLVNLMKYNSGRNQKWHQRQQHGGCGTELLNSKPDDDMSSKWGTVLDDGDNGLQSTSSSAKHLRPSQLKQLYEHQESYNEMLIHPASVDGTAAAAAWHLHGQTGGRETRVDLNSYHKSDQHEIYSAMNTRDIMNVTRELKHDTADSRGDTSPRRQLKPFDSDSDDANIVRMKVMKNGITILSSSAAAAAGAAAAGEGVKATYSETAENLHKKYDGPTKDTQHQRDVWSTGIAAAIVTGTAARYYKTFFMFPHGRQVLLPVITGALATRLSLVTLLSCQFMTILPKTHVNDDEEGVSDGGSGGFSGLNQVLQVGPWRYLSINTSYSDGEVCLAYPSNLAMDMPFLVARSTSALASFFGCVMVLWTLTLICAPASRGNMNALGLCFTLVGVLEGLTALLYQTQNCKSQSFDMTYGTDGGGWHLGGGECRPNQDLVFCIASSILHVATGWMLHVSYKFLSNAGVGDTSSMEVYTWSSEARSSNPKRGILRTVEKCWTKIPDGSTLMATVFVEQRADASGGNCGTGSGGHKLKTTYSIQTEILPA